MALGVVRVRLDVRMREEQTDVGRCARVGRGACEVEHRAAEGVAGVHVEVG